MPLCFVDPAQVDAIETLHILHGRLEALAAEHSSHRRTTTTAAGLHRGHECRQLRGAVGAALHVSNGQVESDKHTQVGAVGVLQSGVELQRCLVKLVRRESIQPQQCV